MYLEEVISCHFVAAVAGARFSAAKDRTLLVFLPVFQPRLCPPGDAVIGSSPTEEALVTPGDVGASAIDCAMRAFYCIHSGRGKVAELGRESLGLSLGE
jgi:hypothetical protein